MRSTAPHDRQVDGLPTTAGYTDGGMVLGRDVARPIQVGVEQETARTTLEPGAGTAVVASNMPAGGAHLGGMPRVYPDHRYASSFGLVPDERLELSERPAMQTTGLLAVADLGSTADVLEILQDNRSPMRAGLDDLLREHVIAVSTEPLLSAAHLPQVSLGGLCALGLEGTAEVEVAGLHRPPTLLPEEAVVGGDGGLGNAKVYADDLRIGSNLRRRQVNDDVEPPVAVALEKVAGQDSRASALFSIGEKLEGEAHAALCGRKPNRPVRPIHLEGVLVEAGRTLRRPRGRYLAPLTPQNEYTPQGFRRFDAGLAMQVRDECRVAFLQRVVGGVVKADTVFLVMRPAVGADLVEDGAEEACGLCEGCGLFRSGLKKYANGAVHARIMPYVPTLCG